MRGGALAEIEHDLVYPSTGLSPKPPAHCSSATGRGSAVTLPNRGEVRTAYSAGFQGARNIACPSAVKPITAAPLSPA
jgi:hypothetical protein